MLGRRAGAHPLGEVQVVGIEAEFATPFAALPGVLGDGVQSGPGEVEPDAADAVMVEHFGLQSGQDPEVLGIALESPARRGELVQRPLAVVPVGRVADVVGQPGHVYQVRVATQRDGHAPADLGDLQRVGQPRSRIVAVCGSSRSGFTSSGFTSSGPDHLGLVGQPAQRRAVQHPGPVAGEVGAMFAVGARQCGVFGRLGH